MSQLAQYIDKVRVKRWVETLEVVMRKRRHIENISRRLRDYLEKNQGEHRNLKVCA